MKYIKIKIPVLKGYLFIIGAAALWALIGPISRFAFSEGMQPMEVAFWRGLLAALFFGTHAWIKGEVSIQTRHIPLVAAFALIGVSMFYVSYLSAVNAGGAALASVLLYTSPAWVAVLSAIFFKESMPPIKIIALFFTLAGVTAVSFGAGSDEQGTRVNAPAIIFGLMAGFSYSSYFLFGKYFSNLYSSPNLFLYLLPIGVIGIFPWVNFCEKSLPVWISLFCLAFFCTYAAYYLYYLGLKILAPTQAAITATLEPVIAGIIAYFWWQESFFLLGYVGSALILTSVLIMIIRN